MQVSRGKWDESGHLCVCHYPDQDPEHSIVIQKVPRALPMNPHLPAPATTGLLPLVGEAVTDTESPLCSLGSAVPAGSVGTFG